MPLTRRADGTQAVNQVYASWWNDFMDLLTGAMTDQNVTIGNVVKVTRQGSTSQGTDFYQMQATTNAAHQYNLYIGGSGEFGIWDGTAAAAMLSGTASGLTLAGNLTLTGTTLTAGNKGNIVFSTDAGGDVSINTGASGLVYLNGTKAYVDSGGYFTTSGMFKWVGTLAGSASTVLRMLPTDTGAKQWGLYYNTDNSLSFYNNTDSITAMKLDATGNMTLNGSIHSSGLLGTGPQSVARIGAYDTSGGLGTPTIAIYIGTTDPTTVAGLTVNNGDLWIKA